MPPRPSGPVRRTGLRPLRRLAAAALIVASAALIVALCVLYLTVAGVDDLGLSAERRHRAAPSPGRAAAADASAPVPVVTAADAVPGRDVPQPSAAPVLSFPGAADGGNPGPDLGEAAFEMTDVGEPVAGPAAGTAMTGAGIGSTSALLLRAEPAGSATAWIRPLFGSDSDGLLVRGLHDSEDRTAPVSGLVAAGDSRRHLSGTWHLVSIAGLRGWADGRRVGVLADLSSVDAASVRGLLAGHPDAAAGRRLGGSDDVPAAGMSASVSASWDTLPQAEQAAVRALEAGFPTRRAVIAGSTAVRPDGTAGFTVDLLAPPDQTDAAAGSGPSVRAARIVIEYRAGGDPSRSVPEIRAGPYAIAALAVADVCDPTRGIADGGHCR